MEKAIVPLKHVTEASLGHEMQLEEEEEEAHYVGFIWAELKPSWNHE